MKVLPTVSVSEIFRFAVNCHVLCHLFAFKGEGEGAMSPLLVHGTSKPRSVKCCLIFFAIATPVLAINLHECICVCNECNYFYIWGHLYQNSTK